MKLLKLLSVIFISLTLMACALSPQKPVALSDGYYDNKERMIGVYIDNLPAADTYFPGASCLLCIAAASAANSDLTDHVRTLTTEDVLAVKAELESILTKKGVSYKFIDEPIDFSKLPKFSNGSKEGDFARSDFRQLKSNLGVDKLIVVDVNQLGVIRSYSAYVPTTDPLGYVYGYVASVDLTTNKYDQYHTLNVRTAVKGEWDEPTTFPGVTTAYFQSIELMKKQVLESFDK